MPSRLDTWKSIAHHMGKSARTLQRWHRVYGLPVHHLSGESGSVFAYGDELDAWLRGRSLSGAADVSALAGIELSAAAVDSDSSLTGGRSRESNLVSPRARERSAQSVGLAARMLDSLSARNLNTIVGLYRDAVDLNPENAEAYAGLATGLIAQGVWMLVYPPSAYAAARAAVNHALAIESELPHAKCADDWLMMLQRRDWAGARDGFNEILRQDPGCTHGMNGRALLHIAEGSIEKAGRVLLRSTEQSPLSSAATALYAWNAYLDGKFRHALEQVNDMRASGRRDPIADVVEALASILHYGPRAAQERLQELSVDSPQNEALRGALGYALAVNGEGQKARELLDSLMGSGLDKMGRDPYAGALVWIGLNDKQKALKSLQQSYRSGSLWSLGFRSDPILDALRNDPICQQVLHELPYPAEAGDFGA